MAKCGYCEQEMLEKVGCTASHYDDFGDNKEYLRIPVSDAYGDKCHDCWAPPGKYHHPGCDMERCPKCGGQAIGCGCTNNEDKEEAFWEYFNKRVN